MSLLRKPKFNTRSKKLMLITVAVLLLVPCVAAAAFAVRFEMNTNALTPVQEKELKEKEKEKLKADRDEMKLREELKMRAENVELDPKFREERLRKEKLEMEMQSIRQAALVRLARVNMDQAIQIATSHTPGKVLLCSLGAKGWEEPGKLANDGVVFYHVVIADEVNAGATHVWVNAIDGSVIKTEKELPRKKRRPEGN